MRYQTHVATTLAASLPIMVATDTLSIGAILVVTTAAIFPDIDHEESYIGSRMRGISDFFRLVFKHRGVIHSLLGLVIFSLSFFMIVNTFSLPSNWTVWFAVGYLFHLLEDSFSKSGVKWLQPLSSQSIQLGFGVVYYKTGSLFDKFIYWVACLLIILQIKSFDLNVYSKDTIDKVRADQIEKVADQSILDDISLNNIDTEGASGTISEWMSKMIEWPKEKFRGVLRNGE